MSELETVVLPDLPLCPKHLGEKVPGGIANCSVCWRRFYFEFENQKHIDRINRDAQQFVKDVERYKQVLANMLR